MSLRCARPLRHSVSRDLCQTRAGTHRRRGQCREAARNPGTSRESVYSVFHLRWFLSLPFITRPSPHSLLLNYLSCKSTAPPEVTKANPIKIRLIGNLRITNEQISKLSFNRGQTRNSKYWIMLNVSMEYYTHTSKILMLFLPRTQKHKR